MWVNPQFYADMFTFTKEILNGKVRIFCALICANKLTENYCEEENNYLFFERSCCFFVHKFWENFLPLDILDVRFWDLYRSSHPEVFLEKGVLKICIKFTGEHPCRIWTHTSAWLFSCKSAYFQNTFFWKQMAFSGNKCL